MKTLAEVKFVVPPAAARPLAAELARGSATVDHASLAALYLDTEDRRLARAGLAWSLRREGRRWIQALQADGKNASQRFEHEVIRPGAVHEAAEHAGTAAGDRLLEILRSARSDGVPVGVRFQTEMRRTARRIRTRGAVVDVAFDEGRMLADEASQRIRAVEFGLASGSATAMLAMAGRWRKRFGLIHDPLGKAERGDQLAAGSGFPPVRKAQRLHYAGDATALEAYGAVIDECLAHVTRNAIGLHEGDPASRVEHVHQMRVGIRRLRSALRSFEDWAPMPPPRLVDELRAVFTTLGRCRDSDVLGSGVVVALAKAGAPPLALPAADESVDPGAVVRNDAVQALFLDWLAWRAALPQHALEDGAAASGGDATRPGGHADAARVIDGNGQAGAQADSASDDAAKAASQDPHAFRRAVERRLCRWHRRIAADSKRFDELDETALHALRKRLKRQRYAVEFFAPLLRRREVERYLSPLAAIQERMGEVNDLLVARGQYERLLASNPAAWFALGWITARVAELRLLAKPELGRLAEADVPTH